MLTTYDLTAVRQFVADLDARRAGCNGEGMYCSDLDAALGCHVEVCSPLLDAVHVWAVEVFAGRAAFDSQVESLFKAEMRRALNDAKPVAERGRAVANECFELERLEELEACVHRIEFLLTNWVSPRRSVAPGPRTAPGPEAEREMLDRAAGLVPLPGGWRPSDPRQARLFDGR